MRGDDIALPTIESRPLDHGVNLPIKVGGNEISWDQPRIKDRKIGRSDRIEAISIVLDAYGILELLDDERRADLLFDIATIFEDDA